MKRFTTSAAYIFLVCLLLSRCQSSPNADMVLVPANAAMGTAQFYIDRFEASIYETKQYQPDGSELTLQTARSQFSEYPKTNVTYAEAKTACERAGKRLCATREWIVACRGTNNYRYGFQNAHNSPTVLSEVCVTGRSYPDGSPVSGMESPLPTLTGTHSRCIPDGFAIYDLIGNASEWTYLSDPNGEYAGSAYDNGAAIGGSYSVSDELNNCSYLLRYDSNDDGVIDALLPPESKSATIGFRCCKNSG